MTEAKGPSILLKPRKWANLNLKYINTINILKAININQLINLPFKRFVAQNNSLFFE